MAKDLIIGGAANYTYDQIKFWINSIQRSGFTGDIVLAVTNMQIVDLEKIAEKGVQILAYGQKDADGNYTSNSGMPPHVERFFYIWNFLSQSENYRYVITTDVRDVVFQRNPSEFLEYSLEMHDLLAAGEGLKYRDEPWGNNNLLQAFGPFFHNRIKDSQIYNVGVIAGKHRTVQDLLLLLMQMSLNRPIAIVDQAVYNFILSMETFSNQTNFVGNDTAWCVNLGTTLGAIASGAGDIGMRNDPTAQILYQSKYMSRQPSIEHDIVKNGYGDVCFVVHQYDRIAGLADMIRTRYND